MCMSLFYMRRKILGGACFWLFPVLESIASFNPEVPAAEDAGGLGLSIIQPLPLESNIVNQSRLGIVGNQEDIH